ncbi:MAG TPA: ATP synthase subunit I [Terracidiphilus sp.]|nr:ATP synthase subunit I [Terracidiphilus sp.]
MTQEVPPLLELSNDAAEVMLQRAMRISLILGVISSAILLVASGWRDAAMLLTGALISAASIFEWQRLARVIRAKLEAEKTPRSAPAVVVFFVLRLILYAGAIYVSLKCFQGSPVALLCGLGLAALTIAWQALRLLLD